MAGPNQKLADIFQQMADLLLILGANRFKVIAFENAARTIGELADDVATMSPEDIAQLPGIGKGTAERIAEFLDTGKIADHQDLLKQVPPGLLDLLDIPGVGPKSVAQLWHEAKVSDIPTLKKKIESGELEQLKGFGAKKVENIRKNLAFAQSANQRMRIGAALPIAQWFVDQLRHIKAVKEAAYAGSLRRGRETIGDLDLLVSCPRKDAPAIRDAFLKLELVKDVLAKGDTKCSIRTPQGMQVDLRLVEPDSYGAALLYFTGSKEHNVALRELALSKGWTLNEYALTKRQTAETAHTPNAVSEEKISEFIRDNFVFVDLPFEYSENEAAKWLRQIQDHLHVRIRANRTDLENLLSCLEDRLMVEFPDPKHPKFPSNHIPYWNRDDPKDSPNTIRQFWSSAAPAPLKRWVSLAIARVNGGNWVNTPNEASGKPGLYVAYHKEHQRVEYVGIAGYRDNGSNKLAGLADRLRLHMSGNTSNSTLRQHVAEYLKQALTVASGGVVLASKTEQEIYKKLGLAWIPPELREARDEIKLAAQHKLPELIALKDIHAELHAHTTASDGRWSIRQLAAAAADRGFHTVAITDHSKGQVQANGLSAERLEQHIQDIRDVADQMKKTITVLAGSEVDILADGKLDYPNSLLKELDVVVASPHGALSQPSEKATARFLKAIDNPYVTIMGHLTGRIINRREGLSPDMKAIFAAVAERGIALEINANHHRLDLRDIHARAAVEAGCKIAINTDAHGPADLDELRYGLLTARRAGLTRGDVINCLDQKALRKWIASTRP